MPAPPIIVPALGLAAVLACQVHVDLGSLDESSSSLGSTSDSGNDSGAVTTGSSEPICGDGVVQAGEECDNAGDDLDGCFSTCESATSCRDVLDRVPDAADGVYPIDPDRAGPNEPFTVYCDMTNDGGGWTLLAKVHRWHAEPNYDEPKDWLAREHDLESLQDPLSYESRLAASASHGEARMGPMITDVDLARVTLIAEDDALQRVSWYKVVEADIWAWFTTYAQAETVVCSNPDMTLNCSAGKIASDIASPSGDRTKLEGMDLSHHGYTVLDNDCFLHMRLNGDGSFYLSGVCSCTFNYDGNAWRDDAVDHWGNGLEIWLR